MMDCVLSGSLLVVFSLFCYGMSVFFRANKLSLSLPLTTSLSYSCVHSCLSVSVALYT